MSTSNSSLQPGVDWPCRIEISGRFLWPPVPQNDLTVKQTIVTGTLTIGYRSSKSNKSKDASKNIEAYVAWEPTDGSQQSDVPWPANLKQCDATRKYSSGFTDFKPATLQFRGGEWLKQYQKINGKATDQPCVEIPLRYQTLADRRIYCSDIKVVRGYVSAEASVQLLMLAFGSEQNGILPTVCIKKVPAIASDEAQAIRTFDLSEKQPKLSDSPIANTTVGLIANEVRSLISEFADLSRFKTTTTSSVIVCPDRNALRWIIGPISSEDFGNKNFLRKSGQNFAISLDQTDRLLIDAGSPCFWLVATATWNEKEDTSDNECGPVSEENFTLEVAWGPQPVSVAGQAYAVKQIIDDANKQCGLARSSLTIVSGGQIESFLPNLNLASESLNKAWAATKLRTSEFEVNAGLMKLKSKPLPKRISLTLLSPFPGPSQCDANNLSCFARDCVAADLTLPGIGNSDKFPVWLSYDSSSESNDGDLDVVASFRVRNRLTGAKPGAGNSWKGRLGALTFENSTERLLVEAEDEKEPDGRLVISWPKSEGILQRPSGNAASRFNVSWIMRLSVTSAIPVTVDRQWGDREARSMPLIVSATEEQSPTKPPAKLGGASLRIKEFVAPDLDRHLVVDFLSSKSDPGNQDETYTLLSLEPWSIMRFTRRRLQNLGDAQNAIVATFDSDTRTWLFKLVQSEYHLQFPPQCVGESADKPRRLELHDINPIDTTDDRRGGSLLKKKPVLQPVPIESRPGDPERSFIVECRLTPSLDLWVRPSDLDRGYFLPEWQAYEIFRQRNDFGLGVSLSGLRGEYIYGLSVWIDPQKESAPTSLARVAEIEAITGSMPPIRWVTEGTSNLLARWKILRKMLSRRHERLEVWSPFYDQPRPFAPAQFGRGAMFALRKTALHRTPVLPGASTGAPPTADAAIRIHENFGLAGGALWPIESQAFVDALRQAPGSTGGVIERIAISPTGGDADQSARFNKDQVVIESSTRNGYVQRQRVEIYGRIGVFWHRARHVVVYERTVNPSEQFAPIPDTNAYYKSRSRRAVIRKVSEYIEILQPSRSYPDLPNASTTSGCGFLDSVRFNSKIIHVDSAWMQDLPEINGYSIPLWNAGAAELRPNVYPLPAISVVTQVEGKEKRPLSPRQIANPENLCFFTTTSPSASDAFDSDKWPAFFGVDYCNLVDPAALESLVAPGGSNFGGQGGFGNQDGNAQTGRKPSTPRTLPGHEKFTWRLIPDSVRTTLNATLGEKPVYGNLESITFSRNERVIPADQLNQSMTLHLGSTLLPLNALSAYSDSLTNSLTQIRGMVDQAATIDVQTIKDQIEAFKKVENKWDEAIKKVTVPKDVKEAIEGARLLPDCPALKKQIVQTLQGKRQLIAEALGGVESKWINIATDWINDSTGVAAAWKQAAAIYKVNAGATADQINLTIRKRAAYVLDQLFKFESYLDGVLQDTQSGVEAIVGQIASARRAIHDAIADVEQTLRRGKSRIQSAISSCALELKWTKQRYDKLRDQVLQEVNGLVNELYASVSEVSQRLGHDLGPLGALLADKVSTAFATEVSTLANSIKATIPPDVPADPTIVTTRVQSILDSVQKQIDALSNLEQTLIATIQVEANAIKTTLGTASDEIRRATSQVLRYGVMLTQIVKSFTDEFLKGFDDICTSATQVPAEKINAFSQQIQLQLSGIVERLRKQVLPLDDVSLVENASQSFDSVCKSLGDHLKRIDSSLFPVLDSVLRPGFKKVKDAYDNLESAGTDLAKLKSAKDELANAASLWSNGMSSAHAYSGRVSSALSNLTKGNPTSIPGNTLKLLSAATTAPELGQLQANIDRLRCSYSNLKIATSKATAAFSKLGDALKALGIELPFNGLSDQLDFPTDLSSNFDFKRLLPNFGGLNLDGLFDGVEMPKSMSDAVKIRHEFDKVNFKASVQIDVNIPLKGRRKLFGLGPFTLYFRDSTLTGLVKAEASKDQDGVSTDESSEISTNIDVDVGGELIVSLQSTKLRYTRASGLKFTFDPRNIRLHAAMQFVQDTLGGLIGDSIGGLKILKDQGIPIGVEHEFALPTISLMAGTSGISNISLGNTFRLLAYPDFVISNRFNLSRPELPFLFSFFIVGGTGFIGLEASYRPFDKTLAVVVETAIGGSAALGFALGPISGSVFVSLSVVLTFRRSFGPNGSDGDGLSVGVLLVIAGQVSLWGIIDVYLGIMLRLTYTENGGIDGLGSVSVKVKICMFLTLSFHSEVRMRLKDGHKTTSVESNSGANVDNDQLARMGNNATRLQGART